MLQISGTGLELSLEEIQPDTTTSNSKKQMATLVVRGTRIPCIIREIVWGDIRTIDSTKNAVLMVSERLHRSSSIYARNGYIDIQIIFQGNVQFYVYIFAHHLKDFFSECVMSILHSTINA